MKISFHAKSKLMSITEYFVTAIIISFRQLREKELRRDGLWDDFDYDDLDCKEDSIGEKMKKQAEFMQKMKNLIVMGNTFSDKLLGFNKILKVKAKLMQARLKFERYIQMQWQLHENPCRQIPDEMRIGTYALSY